MSVAQWIRRGSSSHRVVHAGGPSPSGDSNFFSVLLGIMYFSDIVILCSRPNSCCQQNHYTSRMRNQPQLRNDKSIMIKT